jgi:biopolymer transport protein TolR
MGAPLGAKVGGRGGHRRLYKPMSEINVTPFVDVMLVLLIVFMVTAPLLTVSVPVNLPQTQAKPVASPDKKPLTVSVKEDGSIYVQESLVTLTGLVAALKAIPDISPETRIMVRGDKKNNYGTMVEVLGAIANAGYSKIGLAATLPGASAPSTPARSNPTHR